MGVGKSDANTLPTDPACANVSPQYVRQNVLLNAKCGGVVGLHSAQCGGIGLRAQATEADEEESRNKQKVPPHDDLDHFETEFSER